MGIAKLPFTKLFTVTIQFGAILSVVVLYWRKFFQSFNFYIKLFVGFLPAAVIGLLIHDFIDSLFERIDFIGYMLILGGILFLIVDELFKSNEKNLDQRITPLVALKIGLFQCLAMMPGVSRSGASIIGGLTLKLNKKTAAEFSFFLAVPTMLGASVFKLYSFIQEGRIVNPEEIKLLLIGNIVSFVVAMIAIKSFIAFLTKYGFRFFGFYRILIGCVLLTLYYLGIDLKIV